MLSKRGHISIAGRRIGEGEPCYVIAEIGVNHNGEVEIAKKLIDAAVTAGVDAVKFQKRSLQDLYQKKILTEPRLGEQGLQYIVPILTAFELSNEQMVELYEYCGKRNVTFLCTPFDIASADFLERIDIPAYKIGSPDLTNFPLIRRVARTGKPLLLSTGMSTEEEIQRTLNLLDELNAECALFHCVSTYPATPDEINLRFSDRLRSLSGRPVGYSGHETGTSISIAAVALGASLLERHITLDRAMRGPDHSASLEPRVFAEQVAAIRDIEAALGEPRRWLTRGEVLNRRVLGKSIVAARDLSKGTILDSEMLIARSPGLGISPQEIDRFIGQTLARPIAAEDLLTESHVAVGHSTRDVEETSIDLPVPWGFVARFTDVDELHETFRQAQLIEFHVSDRDLDLGASAFNNASYDCDLIVHAPEYFHDSLIDLCASSDDQRLASASRIQMAINLARGIAGKFGRLGSQGPKIVVHVGGMTSENTLYDKAEATNRLLKTLETLDTRDVELLLENIPPYPWFFGGRWFDHIMVDQENTVDVCRRSGFNLCFDTSHAALACNSDNARLLEFAEAVLPYIRHLHVSDGAGTSGEGLQIGEGQINFLQLLPVLFEAQTTLVPEIWQGHHNKGEGFRIALHRLTELSWVIRALSVSPLASMRPSLRALTTSATTTVRDTLKVIEKNGIGIAFIVDETGSLVGIATDGDIRRGLIQGFLLDEPINRIMVKDFLSARSDMPVESIRRMLSNRYRVVPVIDSARRLSSVVSIYDGLPVDAE